MRNTRKKWISLCLSLLMVFPLLSSGIASTVFASSNKGITDGPGKIIIPFTKNWEGDDPESRPDEISVSLYKYSATFDPSSDELIETKTVTSEDEWKCSFDISEEALFDEDGEPYQFAVVEAPIAGYKEDPAQHVDPEVSFTPPTDPDGWEKISPCDQLNITTTGTNKSVVIAKKGNAYIVWTVDALSPTERKIICSSASAEVNGMGNLQLSNCTFISGIDNSYAGMTVTSSSITFDKPSDWAFFATGLYSKSSSKANASSITNVPAATPGPGGSLKITKNVYGIGNTEADQGLMADYSVTFVYNTVCGTASINQFVYDAENDCWTGSISLTLDDNTAYAVCESEVPAVDGYDSPAAALVTGGDKQDGTGTIAANDTDEVIVSNTYVTHNPEPETGSFMISKTVAGTGTPASNTQFEFTITPPAGTVMTGTYAIGNMEPQEIPSDGIIALQAGETAILSGLTAGTYTVTETSPTHAYYRNTSFSVNGAETQQGLSTEVVVSDTAGSVTSSNTEVALVTFTNNYRDDGGDFDPSYTPDKDPTPKSTTALITPSTPDKPIDNVPQTDDTSNTTLWLVLMSISFMGMCSVVVFGHKKRYRDAYKTRRD